MKPYLIALLCIFVGSLNLRFSLLIPSSAVARQRFAYLDSVTDWLFDSFATFVVSLMVTAIGLIVCCFFNGLCPLVLKMLVVSYPMKIIFVSVALVINALWCRYEAKQDVWTSDRVVEGDPTPDEIDAQLGYTPLVVWSLAWIGIFCSLANICNHGELFANYH